MMAASTTTLPKESMPTKETKENGTEPADDFNCFGRLGSQLDEKFEFKNKFGESVWATPIIVDFLRVLQLGQVDETNGVIAGVSNRELLHAVVALYDISLSDMDTETLYSVICAKWSRTIILVQDVKDAADDMTERNVKKRKKKKEEKKSDKNKDKKEDKENQKHWSERINAAKDVLVEEEIIPSAFTEVFSDTESEDGDNEDEDEEDSEDYSKGIHAFITKSIERRKARESCDGIVPPSMIGIENRLLGCATFEKKFVQHKDRVIHLTLISVRPRFRKYRIGRYLLAKCVSPSVVGQHEAVVVHADNSAVEFFRKFGFSDDTILNSKWNDLADAFTNCTLMSYLPGFSGHSLLYTNVTRDMDPDLYDIDHELKSWQEKSKQAYQGHLCCLMRLRNEILQLKCLVGSQSTLLNKLITDSDGIRKEKLLLEKEITELRIGAAKNIFSAATGEQNKETSDDDTATLIEQLESQVAALCKPTPKEPPTERPVATPPKQSEPIQNKSGEIISRFIEGMEMDRAIQVRYSVTSILKAPDNHSLRNLFEDCLEKMHDSSMVTELYYCGSLERPSRLQQILKEGFKDSDFSHGEFGRGLYFTKYPSKAAQFSDLGKLLEVKVGLGKVETVMRYDRTRKCPAKDCDSVISPGRLYKPGDQGDVAMLSQEYIVFNVNQVLPLCIIHYSANPGGS